MARAPVNVAATPRPRIHVNPSRSQRAARGIEDVGGEDVLSGGCGIGSRYEATRHYKNLGVLAWLGRLAQVSVRKIGPTIQR